MQNDTPVAPESESKPKRRDLAARNYLDMFSGGTHEMYGRDLRIFFAWCDEREIKTLKATRVQLEQFSRHLREERGNGSSSIAGRLSTVRGYYKIAVADRWIKRDPAILLRSPRIELDPSRLTGISLMETGIMLRHARQKGPMYGALIGLMSLLGLRVSEAIGIQIEDFQTSERGHRVIKFIGKGNKKARMVVPPQLYVILSNAAGERTTGTLILGRDGLPISRQGAYRWVKAMVKTTGVNAKIHPHSFRHGAITNSLDSGISIRDAGGQGLARHKRIETTMGYDRNANELDRSPVYQLSALVAAAAA